MSEAGRNSFKIDKSDKRKYPVVRDRFIDFDLFYRFFLSLSQIYNCVLEDKTFFFKSKCYFHTSATKRLAFK